VRNCETPARVAKIMLCPDKPQLPALTFGGNLVVVRRTHLDWRITNATLSYRSAGARAAAHVYSVTREDGTSVIKPLPATRSYTELMGEMSFAAYQELGFEQILCVEGIHDVPATQQFLRILGLDQKIVIIPLGGSAFINPNTGPQLNELKRIASRVAVLIDSEKTSANAPLSQDREGFVGVCQSLSIKIHVTVLRALEHYLTDIAVKKAKGPSYRALQPYEDFKTFAKAWSKDDNWRIAQHMTLADLSATDLEVWLSGLTTAANT
jgi:hypothetical protein